MNMRTRSRAFLAILLAAAGAAALLRWSGRTPERGAAPLARDDATGADVPRSPHLVGPPAARVGGSPGTREDHETGYGPDVEDEPGPVEYEVVARDVRTDEPIPGLRVRLETSTPDWPRDLHVTTDALGGLSVPVSTLRGVESETEGWTARSFELAQVTLRRVLYFHRWFEVAGRLEWEGRDPVDLREVEVQLSDGRGFACVARGPDEAGRFRARLPWVHAYHASARHP